MLEKLPDAIGHALRDQRAGLENIAFHAIGLRAGMGSIDVRSLAFADHAAIPERYTADGDGVSPPLQWSQVPTGTAAVIVIVEDADSPTPQPLVHGLVIDLPAEQTSLPEGALPSADHEGAGVQAGLNSYLQASWLPPDPPPGHGVHRYAFQVFALRERLSLEGAPGRTAVIEGLRESAVASGCLIGTYCRPDGSIGVGTTAPVGGFVPTGSATT